MKNQIKLILASTSPRRKMLLRQAGLEFETIRPLFEEKPNQNLSAKKLVDEFSYQKALSIAEKIQKRFPKAVILSSDTVVVAPDGKAILEKPLSQKDAEKMLEILQGQRHWVFSGYCLFPIGLPEKPVLRKVVKTAVWMHPLTPGDVRAYVRSGESMDKSGAYAAQGLGAALVSRIEGSYTSVVGLPLSEVLFDLKEAFNISFLKK
jgi:septum formation protein